MKTLFKSKSLSFVIVTGTLHLGGCSKSEFTGNAAKPPKKSQNAGNVQPTDAIGTPGIPTPPASELPIATDDGCIDLPAGGDPLTSTFSGGAMKNSIFHRVVAVDPGSTGGFDPAKGISGYVFTPLSPATEMSTNEFVLSSGAIVNIIKQGVTEIEYMAFAHQGKEGLDRISLALHTKSDDLSDTLSPNIYSAYGYVSVKNMKIVADKPVGDVDLFSFSYVRGAMDSLNVTIRAGALPHDGTGIAGPASKNAVPKVTKKGISLEDFKLVITIGADSYDSVQYRAIRANLWAPNALTPIPGCK